MLNLHNFLNKRAWLLRGRLRLVQNRSLHRNFMGYTARRTRLMIGLGMSAIGDSWDAFAARAAKKTGRPCRAMLDRREEHLIAGNRPDTIQSCKFSVNKDGTLQGASVESWGTAGVGRGAGVYNPGIYNFEGRMQTGHEVRTNAGRGRAFRAPRHPQGVFALEGMIDELADAIGMDPL